MPGYAGTGGRASEQGLRPIPERARPDRRTVPAAALDARAPLAAYGEGRHGPLASV
jgi:hypothetical protein